MKITDNPKVKTSDLIGELEESFQVYSYWDATELDKEFPPPLKETVREFKLEKESSDFKGKSWNEMDKTNMMTMREYILFFMAYHKETGEYPDTEGWTVFKDRLSDDDVAFGYWHPNDRQVGFGWNDPDSRSSYRGARCVEISLTPPSLVPLEDRVKKIEDWIQNFSKGAQELKDKLLPL